MAVAKSTTKQRHELQLAGDAGKNAPAAANALGVEAARTTQAYSASLGICSTCAHQPRCLFVRAARQPIQFCEEFDDRSQAGQPGQQTRPRLRQVATDGQAVDPGICVNCDSRLTCMHRKPGVTMYSCEEYS